MNELALFAGIGGNLLTSYLLGWTPVCAVEKNRTRRKCLLARQRDKLFNPFPIWDDVFTFEGKPWNGLIDVVTGGFPGQDVSVAGKKEYLTAGRRRRIYANFERIIQEVEPPYVFVENPTGLINQGLDSVLRTFASLGYDATWGVLGAWHFGGAHRRDRVYVVAYSDRLRLKSRRAKQSKQGIGMASEAHGMHSKSDRPTISSQKTDHSRISEHRRIEVIFQERKAASAVECAEALQVISQSVREPRMGRVVDGNAERFNRIAALGDSCVPQVGAIAFQILSRGWTR